MTNIQQIAVGPIAMDIEDEDQSCSRAGARQELLDGNFDFKLPPGATFVDVGANIGIVSIYVAKRNPDCRVVSLEPFFGNYELLQRNVIRSGLTNITTLPFAVAESSDLNYSMIRHPSCTGGATHWSRIGAVGGHESQTAAALSLDDVFYRFVPESGVALKIDTEGSEHGICRAFTNWQRLIHLHLEIHTNDKTRSHGYTPETLIELASSKLPEGITRKFHTVKMGQ